MGLDDFVSKEIFCPLWNEENSSSETITRGIFVNAHPVTTVKSAFLQIIASGAELLDFIE